MGRFHIQLHPRCRRIDRKFQTTSYKTVASFRNSVNEKRSYNCLSNLQWYAAMNSL